MEKQYFERFNEFREFDPENNRITSIGNYGANRFYISIDTLESDVHFDGALIHEKLNVKRTNHAQQTEGPILRATNEDGVTTETAVNENIPITREIQSTEFESVKATVINRLSQLNLI